jgi:protein-tyrosine phosphatase
VSKTILDEVRRYRSFTAVERAIYLRIRALNGFGFMNSKRSLPPKTARSFLFVCFGNIMRSPMCEALMNRSLEAVPNTQITVTSAGLNAVPGRAAHPWALAAAREFGIALDSHRARLLTVEMVNRADVILAMDYQNQVQLFSRYSQARDKVFMLSTCASDEYDQVEIHDPYYGGETATRDCYKILDACIHNLMQSLICE